MIEERVYFMPGDKVTLRQEIPNKPIMIVVKKESYMFKNKDNNESTLKGIRCRWFTDNGFLQEAIFNTKDIIKL